MSVVVSSQDVGPWRKELRIEVPGPAVEAETARVVLEYSKKARIPGFRKGKTPADLVRRRFRAEIDQEVLERLVPRYWKQAESEASLDSLTSPTVGGVVHEDGQPLTFTVTVEVRPEIELDPDRSFELPEMSVAVTPPEVEVALERLRRDLAPWKGVERTAGRGDRVKLRLLRAGAHAAGLDEEGGDTEGRRALATDGGQEVEIELGDPRVWEELSLAVTGLGAGQEGRFERAADPAGHDHADHDHADHDHADPAPPVQESYRFAVLEVQEKELAELDDEFAKNLGSFASLAELRSVVEARIARDKESDRREQRREALLDQLITRHPLELPAGVVEQEVRSMMEDYAEGLRRRGVDLERVGVDWAAMAERVRPQAQRRVHARLVVEAVAAADQITLSEQEFESALALLAKAEGQSTAAVRQALDRAGRLGGLRRQMLRDKTIRHLLGEPIPAEGPLPTSQTGSDPDPGEAVDEPPKTEDSAEP